MAKLTARQKVTIEELAKLGASKREIARKLQVTEGTIRYQLKRSAERAEHAGLNEFGVEGSEANTALERLADPCPADPSLVRESAAVRVRDGRAKVCRIEEQGLEELARRWWQDHSSASRPASILSLHEYLVREWGYSGSYKSVRKFVLKLVGPTKVRAYRRIETPPGSQMQTDWGELTIDIGDATGLTKLYALVMVLSHSRKLAVVWSRSMDQLAWHTCHHLAFRRLGGVAACNRIDNLKTGIARGAGAWGEINEQYRAYARMMGFHVDACEARSPEQKGKTERRVGLLKSLRPETRSFSSLEELQSWTDAELARREETTPCPATGRSIASSWESERELLRPLPDPLPEPFDVMVTRKVHKDATVRFEGRAYTVPFRKVGQEVEILGCSGTVRIVDPVDGSLLVTYERHSEELLLIDPSCYEGKSTDRVEAPKPLGRMTRKLLELGQDGVQRRSIEIYARLAEVAR